MGTNCQGHMPNKASLEITPMDLDVFKLWLSQLHLKSINNLAVKLRANAQVLKERDHAKTLSVNKIMVY